MQMVHWTFTYGWYSRDARWEEMEGAGEDPFGSLVIKLGVLIFKGKTFLMKYNRRMCKHFTGYGFSEAGRDYNTADFNEYALNSIVPPFKAAVDAGVRTFMNYFNWWSYSNKSHKYSEILRWLEFWRFIVSDLGSIEQMIPHRFARDSEHAAELAVNAGSDMDMESSLYVSKLVIL